MKKKLSWNMPWQYILAPVAGLLFNNPWIFAIGVIIFIIGARHYRKKNELND